MEITIYRSFSEENISEIIPNLFRFSYLMIDGQEKKEAVYCTTTTLMKHGNGCFFTIAHNNKKIAYGVFSYGRDNREVRRLYYFAVEREYRKSGLGMKALKLALKTEVDINHGCSVACKPELRSFYEKAGFIFYSSALGRDDEIVLAYFNPVLMSIEDCMNQIICKIQVLPESIEIFSKVKELLKKQGIRPPKK